MRKRTALTLLTALGLVVGGGGLAYADPFSGEPGQTGPVPAAEPVTVTLPTGDQVRVTGTGPVDFRPAGGREDIGFHSPRLPGTGRVVIPLDQREQVRSGKTDARLYNVDALLRNGYTDAREVESADSLGDPIPEPESRDTKAATTVTVEYTWLDGSVPDYAGGTWINTKTGDMGGIEADKGVATVKLPPGEYGLMHELSTDGETPSDMIAASTSLTVTDTAAKVAVKGQDAEELGFNVDREVDKATHTEVEFFMDAADNPIGSIYQLNEKTRLHAIPSDKPAGFKAGYTLRSQLSSPEGSADPYSYSLFAMSEDGFPTDPKLTVHDDQLAGREMNYTGLGGSEAKLATGNLGDHETHSPFGKLPGAPITVPGTVTEFYTADPALEWSHTRTFGCGDREDIALRDSGAMEPGFEAVSWFAAPLSVGVSDPGFPYFGSGIERWEHDAGVPELVVRPPLFTSGSADEAMLSWGLKGEAVISKDGKELGTSTDGSSVAADLPKDDEGRYKVALDAEREVDWTPLGTRSTATWEFDSAPVTEATPLGVSVVRFNAEGIAGGYADAAAPQAVTLDFATQPGAEDRTCADMAFQVSYDDGENWKDVAIDRDGDHATATLEHPEQAKFVSVKFTAEDDRGQTVEHSSIRSYGLE